MAKDKKKKLPKGFVPFKKKSKKKEKLDENIVKFVDLMISENYKDAHKFLEVVIHNKIKQRIAEASKQELFPKAKDSNPSYLKNSKKKTVKK